ncbi:MAG: nucleotidyltransferase domain-containing protein [Chloroflexi bacterium]|nr:nucleotidyltransferase domain-containing protein [Chloroflexota bacterium]
MVTQHVGSTSFWQRLRRGPWGKPVTDRIEEALDRIVRRLRADDAVAAIVVFGSYARGDFGRKSDLDLLFLLRSLEDSDRIEAERRVVAAVVEMEGLLRLPVHIAPLIAEARCPEALGPALLHEVWTDGIVLYGEAALLAGLQPGGLAPWSVVRFSLQGAAPRERVRLARRLHGSNRRPGIIRLPGLDLARGAALVPAEQARAVQSALDDAGASYAIIPVWREV